MLLEKMSQMIILNRLFLMKAKELYEEDFISFKLNNDK
jgi:hypothetical protein